MQKKAENNFLNSPVLITATSQKLALVAGECAAPYMEGNEPNVRLIHSVLGFLPLSRSAGSMFPSNSTQFPAPPFSIRLIPCMRYINLNIKKRQR